MNILVEIEPDLIKQFCGHLLKSLGKTEIVALDSYMSKLNLAASKVRRHGRHEDAVYAMKLRNFKNSEYHYLRSKTSYFTNRWVLYLSLYPVTTAISYYNKHISKYLHFITASGWSRQEKNQEKQTSFAYAQERHISVFKI